MSANSAHLGIPKQDLETPALVLDLAAYHRNAQKMASYLGDRGVSWRPHMKGQKAPELGWMAVQEGAIGVTCATVYEAEAMADAGVKSILLANQTAGALKQRRLARLAKRTGLISATDSAAHALQLAEAAKAEHATIPVIIELNVGMNRSGIAPGEPAIELARLISTTEGLHFAGFMGWEGHTLAWQGEEKANRIAGCLSLLVDTAEKCRAAGIPVEIVSAAGSGTFLDAANVKGLTEVQAGGGVFSDLSYAKWGLEHDFALTVLTRVASRPAPDRIIVDGGFKTMSVQHGMPQPLGLPAIKSLVLSAEHGNIELEEPSETPRVGDLVEFIPGYTDSTVCLHDEMAVIENGVLKAVWRIPGRTGRK